MFASLSIALIFALAGFVQGLTGFGSALVAMPLLTLFLDSKTAVPLCNLNGLLITFFLSWQLKDSVRMGKIMPLLVGSIPGIFLGVGLLKAVSDTFFKLLLGGLLVSYSVYALFFRPAPRRLHGAWSYLAGFGTGLISAAFSAGGPPTIIYTTLTDWSKEEIKATLSGFFFISGLIVVLAQALSGLTTVAVLRHFAISSLAVLAGAMLGSLSGGAIHRQGYIKLMLGLLLVMGVMMMLSAI